MGLVPLRWRGFGGTKHHKGHCLKRRDIRLIECGHPHGGIGRIVHSLLFETTQDIQRRTELGGIGFMEQATMLKHCAYESALEGRELREKFSVCKRDRGGWRHGGGPWVALEAGDGYCTSIQ